MGSTHFLTKRLHRVSTEMSTADAGDEGMTLDAEDSE